MVLDTGVEIRDEHTKSSKPKLEAASLSYAPMESREPTDDSTEQLYHNNDRQTQQRQKWKTARTIVGAFSLVLSLALLGLGVKMSVANDEAPLIHVSVA